MAGKAAEIHVDWRAEGRLVQIWLTQEEVEELLTRRSLDYRAGQDDVTFRDDTAPDPDKVDEPNNRPVTRCEIRIVDQFYADNEDPDFRD